MHVLIGVILSYIKAIGLYLQRTPYSLYTFLFRLGSVLSAIHFWTLDFLRELIRAMPYLTLTEFDVLQLWWAGQTIYHFHHGAMLVYRNGIRKVNHKRSLFQIKFNNLVARRVVETLLREWKSRVLTVIRTRHFLLLGTTANH